MSEDCGGAEEHQRPKGPMSKVVYGKTAAQLGDLFWLINREAPA